MADYVNLTIADAIAQAEGDLAPRAQIGDTVLYTFRSVSGAIVDRPAMVHGVQADGTLALTVMGLMNECGVPTSERYNVRHDTSGEPGTWRHRGGDWR